MRGWNARKGFQWLEKYLWSGDIVNNKQKMD